MSDSNLLPHPTIALPLANSEYRYWLYEQYRHWPRPPYYPGGGYGDRPHAARLPDSLPVVLELRGDSDETNNVAFGNLMELLPDAIHGRNASIERIAPRYVSCNLTPTEMNDLVELDARREERARGVGRIWPDFPVRPLLYESLSTINAATAWRDYKADGDAIVWAVVDSGIDKAHEHFTTYDTLDTRSGVTVGLHKDFTLDADPNGNPQPLVDTMGHGTHVAGIIAGALEPLGNTVPRQAPYGVYRQQRPVGDQDKPLAAPVTGVASGDLRGVAPRCKLVSLKVIDVGDDHLPFEQRSSRVIKALEYVRTVVNQQTLVIQGVNLSLGYEFSADWDGCGQSPVCHEIDRLVSSGVVVVVAAGNTGYGQRAAATNGLTSGGLAASINDPGNAEGAITVGATRASRPDEYGIAYFSSKGPTVDGRPKPDLVAPGERIVSCAAGGFLNNLPAAAGNHANSTYVDASGTSQAAPHVSGAIAAFLSANPTYRGKPRDIKALFLATARPLQRDRYFEGHGLLDLVAAQHRATSGGPGSGP